MREQIEAKMNEWQQGLEQLQAHRQRQVQELTETDIAIQRNAGAIAAARELLQLIDAPAAEPTQEIAE
jgi:hypothetical protein